MFIPNGFRPSAKQAKYTYDPEGKLREYSESRGSTGGIGDSNSLYATDAEKFGTVAPFLKNSMAKDRPRRNYVIQPGGRSIYFGRQPAPSYPYDDRPMYEAGDERDVFGHARPISGPPAVNSSTRFSVGMNGNLQARDGSK